VRKILLPPEATAESTHSWICSLLLICAVPVTVAVVVGLYAVHAAEQHARSASLILCTGGDRIMRTQRLSSDNIITTTKSAEATAKKKKKKKKKKIPATR
jgi:hypothetical protein